MRKVKNTVTFGVFALLCTPLLLGAAAHSSETLPESATVPQMAEKNDLKATTEKIRDATDFNWFMVRSILQEPVRNEELPRLILQRKEACQAGSELCDELEQGFVVLDMRFSDAEADRQEVLPLRFSKIAAAEVRDRLADPEADSAILLGQEKFDYYFFGFTPFGVMVSGKTEGRLIREERESGSLEYLGKDKVWYPIRSLSMEELSRDDTFVMVPFGGPKAVIETWEKSVRTDTGYQMPPCFKRPAKPQRRQ